VQGSTIESVLCDNVIVKLNLDVLSERAPVVLQ